MWHSLMAITCCFLACNSIGWIAHSIFLLYLNISILVRHSVVISNQLRHSSKNTLTLLTITLYLFIVLLLEMPLGVRICNNTTRTPFKLRLMNHSNQLTVQRLTLCFELCSKMFAVCTTTIIISPVESSKKFWNFENVFIFYALKRTNALTLNH